MSIDRSVVIKEMKSVVILVILGMLFAWTGLGCNECTFGTPRFWKIGSLNALMWVALWKGNSYLANFISWKWPWIKFPMKRFVIGLIVTIVYSLAAMYGIIALYSWSLQVAINYSTGYSILITFILSLFMNVR